METCASDVTGSGGSSSSSYTKPMSKPSLKLRLSVGNLATLPRRRDHHVSKDSPDIGADAAERTTKTSPDVNNNKNNNNRNNSSSSNNKKKKSSMDSGEYSSWKALKGLGRYFPSSTSVGRSSRRSSSSNSDVQASSDYDTVTSGVVVTQSPPAPRPASTVVANSASELEQLYSTINCVDVTATSAAAPNDGVYTEASSAARPSTTEYVDIFGSSVMAESDEATRSPLPPPGPETTPRQDDTAQQPLTPAERWLRSIEFGLLSSPVTSPTPSATATASDNVHPIPQQQQQQQPQVAPPRRRRQSAGGGIGRVLSMPENNPTSHDDWWNNPSSSSSSSSDSHHQQQQQHHVPPLLPTRSISTMSCVERGRVSDMVDGDDDVLVRHSPFDDLLCLSTHPAATTVDAVSYFRRVPLPPEVGQPPCKPPKPPILELFWPGD